MKHYCSKKYLSVPSNDTPAIVLSSFQSCSCGSFILPVVLLLFRVATLAAASVPEEILEAFVVSVVAEAASY